MPSQASGLMLQRRMSLYRKFLLALRSQSYDETARSMTRSAIQNGYLPESRIYKGTFNPDQVHLLPKSQDENTSLQQNLDTFGAPMKLLFENWREFLKEETYYHGGGKGFLPTRVGTFYSRDRAYAENMAQHKDGQVSEVEIDLSQVKVYPRLFGGKNFKKFGNHKNV